MSRTLVLAVLVALAACGEPSSEAPPAAPSRVEREEAASERAEPAPSAVEAPTETPPELAATGLVDLPAAPTSGCAFGGAALVAPGDGWADIAAAERAFFIVGSTFDGGRERVFAVRIELDGSVRSLVDAPLERAVTIGHRRAAPALEVSRGTLALALVDGEQRVLLGELPLRGGELTWTAIGHGGSLRFSPALAPTDDGWALAWTVEEGESLRVRTAMATPKGVSDANELRAPAGGAAAPSFVVGGAESPLVFLDPRAGLSVAHRVPVTAHALAEPTVARPLNLVAEPPEIVVVRAGGSEWIAYTAVGRAATTAVGLARLDDTAPPSPLVPGTGYGVLHVDAASASPGQAIFVADAPQDTPPGAPRELHVRVLSAEGALGAPVIIRGPSEQAARGRIAHVGEGIVAVSFTEPAGVHVAIGRCALAP